MNKNNLYNFQLNIDSVDRIPNNFELGHDTLYTKVSPKMINQSSATQSNFGVDPRQSLTSFAHRTANFNPFESNTSRFDFKNMSV